MKTPGKAASPKRRRRVSLAGALCLLTVFLWLTGCNPAPADEPEGAEQVKEVAQKLLACFADPVPKDLAEHFSGPFLKAVDAAKVEQIFKSLYKEHGRAKEVRLARMTGPYAAEMEVLFEKGVRVPMALTLEAKPPHRVAGIYFRHAVKENETFEEVLAEIKALPGTVSLCVQELQPKPRTIWHWNADQPLAIGSTFKLMILAALVDDIEKGKRTWSDVVPVRKELASLPAGLVQDWPEGAPVTLHTLATLMISRSDNTATDHLLRNLGRQRIEELQKQLAPKTAGRNEPFLSTGELFRIKLVMKPEEQTAYLAADAAGRRALLDSLVKKVTLDRPRVSGEPLLIDQIEWFYTTADLCRILDWFRQQPGRTGDEARQILAINRGLALDKSQWPYAGYKGGSEPGILNLTFLLKDKQGRDYALALTWNNPKQDVDLTKLTGLAQRLIALLSRL